MQHTFPVVLVPQPAPHGGYFVECPGLPGCYSQGETYDEAIANIREAIELVLEDVAASGEAPPLSPIPMPVVAEVRVAV